MTDLAKIRHDAEEALELLVASEEALEAFLTAAEAYATGQAATNTAIRTQLEAIVAEASNGEPPVGLPVLSIADAEPVLAGQVAEFLVSLSDAQPDADVSVEWDTANGEAGGIAEFHDEAAEYLIEIETDEWPPGTFEVILSKPIGATLGRATATGTILPADDGSLPVLNIHDAQPVQTGAVARFGVAISGPIEHEAASVTWTASNGETENLPLGPGNHTVVIYVRTSVAAGAGTLTVTLSDPVGCTIGDATATCTILPADDGSLPKASLLDAEDTVLGEVMIFPLELNKPLAEDASITLAIEGAEPIQVPLAAGVTYLDIPVPIPADAAPGIWSATISGADPTEIEIVRGEAIGRVVAELPASGLPASGSNVTAPIVSPAGAWREMRTFAAVVKLDSAPSANVKVAGGDSTVNAFGGWVLERTSGGQMQAWVYVGGTAVDSAVMTARSTGQLPIGSAVFVAVRMYSDRIVLTMDGQTFTKIFTGTVDAFDGPSVVGDGYWKHELAGAWPGKIEEWKALPTALSDADLAALAEEWLG